MHADTHLGQNLPERWMNKIEQDVATLAIAVRQIKSLSNYTIYVTHTHIFAFRAREEKKM